MIAFDQSSQEFWNFLVNLLNIDVELTDDALVVWLIDLKGQVENKAHQSVFEGVLAHLFGILLFVGECLEKFLIVQIRFST